MADFKEGAEVRIRNEPDVVGFEVGGLAMTLGQPVKVVTFRDRGATVIKTIRVGVVKSLKLRLK